MDLVSSQSQTEASENDLAQVESRQYDEWYASDAYLEWRAIETQTDDYVEWFAWASATWLDWWHDGARSWGGRFPAQAPNATVYDKAEV